MKVLRPSRAARAADHDVRLADHRQRVDPGGHPAEHHQPLLEVAGPAADAVERRPGDGERGSAAGRRRRRASPRRGSGAASTSRRPGPAVGVVGDPAGEDPQPVALRAPGAAGEAGRERVRRAARRTTPRAARASSSGTGRPRRARRVGLGAGDHGRGRAVERRRRAATPSATGIGGVERRRPAQRDRDGRPRRGAVVGAVVVEQAGERAGGPAAVAGGRAGRRSRRGTTRLRSVTGVSDPRTTGAVERLAALGSRVVDDRSG